MAEGDLGAGYEALERGERGPLAGLLAPGFEWVEPDGSVSRDLAALEGVELAVGELVEAGDRALVTGTMRSSGLELPFAHVWELRDDLAARATAYYDRGRLTAAATRRGLAEVADDLLDQAAEIRHQWDRLGDALRAAGLESEGPVSDEADARSAPHAGGASARLVAVDMAHEGSSREEIAAVLREELGVEDVDAVLDEVLAPEGGVEPVAGDDDATAEARRLARLFARNRG
jgi:hypothetical protein